MLNSHFHNINLSDTKFDDINMSNVTFHNINMSDSMFDCINMGGIKFINIGPAPDKDGKRERQRPITFEEMMLCDSKFNKVDMSGVEIKECNIEGMNIDGILVSKMIKVYKKQS
jgi:uncharacterized protein YjbI with pentapeptide repeats